MTLNLLSPNLNPPTPLVGMSLSLLASGVRLVEVGRGDLNLLCLELPETCCAPGVPQPRPPNPPSSRRPLVVARTQLARRGIGEYDPDTGETILVPRVEPAGIGQPDPKLTLLTQLLAAHPDSAAVRTDSNWSIGSCDGVVPLQLALLLPAASDIASVDPVDLGVIRLLTTACPAAAVLTTPRGDDPRWSVQSALTTCAVGHGDEACSVCAGCQCTHAALHRASIHIIADDLATALGADPTCPGTTPTPPPPTAAATTVPSVAERRAHGAAYGMGWSPAEFVSLLSDEAMHGLVEIDFFDGFTDAMQRRLFNLASLVAQTDCINSPSRAAAERRVGDEAETSLMELLDGHGCTVRGGNAAPPSPGSYRVEEMLRTDPWCTGNRITPDILFDEEVQLDGISQPIRWIDSKNGWFVPGLSMDSKLRSLKRQALKYEYFLGPGLFLWHKGFFESLGNMTPTGVCHAAMVDDDDDAGPVFGRVVRGKLELHKRSVNVWARQTGVVIGKAGATVKRLEEEYDVFVVIPSRDPNASPSRAERCTVEIAGYSEAGVVAARADIVGMLHGSYDRGGRGNRAGGRGHSTAPSREAAAALVPTQVSDSRRRSVSPAKPVRKPCRWEVGDECLSLFPEDGRWHQSQVVAPEHDGVYMVMHDGFDEIITVPPSSIRAR